MTDITEIQQKYIKKADPNRIPKKPLGQNLQPDIQKVESTIRKISEKQAPQAELNRLRTSVIKLLAVIDNNDQYHL